MMNELKHLARNGSLTAALFLKDHYKDKDVDMEYRYTCYSALAGDLNSAIELYNSDMKVMRAFVDDCTVDDLLRFNEIPIEHIESHATRCSHSAMTRIGRDTEENRMKDTYIPKMRDSVVYSILIMKIQHSS